MDTNRVVMAVGCSQCPQNVQTRGSFSELFDFAKHIGEETTCEGCGTHWILQDVQVQGGIIVKEGSEVGYYPEYYPKMPLPANTPLAVEDVLIPSPDRGENGEELVEEGVDN